MGWVRVAEPPSAHSSEGAVDAASERMFDRTFDPSFDPSFDLGIDTASDDASLALFPLGDDRPLAVKRFRPESTMSRELIGTIAGFLAEAGVERGALARIAVTTGPGQYGPLRAGIAVAQGMALALEVPLAGVGRLEADAALVRPEGGARVVAVHDTRTGPAWAAYEVVIGDAPREVVAPSITSYEEAVRRAPRPAVWTGEVGEALTSALADARDAARDAGSRTGDTVAAAPGTPRAVAIVRIARVRGAFGDPAGVDAVYLRPPPITPPPIDGPRA